MLRVDLQLDHMPGRPQRAEAPTGVTAIWGPSGCGKTSLLRAIAGLDPCQGVVHFNGQEWRGVLPKPHLRKAAMVFQDGRLFDHLTVAGNLQFAAKRARGAAPDVVRMLDLAPLMTRRPRQLSGGERKRVALGQALLSGPDLLMLDEPLSGLDATRRNDILPYLEQLRHQPGLVTLLVTHDISEAARLADHLWVMGGAGISAQGPMMQILADPNYAQVLGPRQAGAVVDGQIAGHDPRDDLTEITVGLGRLFLPGRVGQAGAAIRLRIPAHDVILSLDAPDGLSALGAVPVQITTLAQGAGPGVAVGLQSGGVHLLARVTRRSAEQLELRPGLSLFAIVKATAIAPFDVPQVQKV